MYLVLTIKAPSNLANFLEEEFYEIPNLSWETEEKPEEILFKFYFPFSLKAEDEEKLAILEKITAKFAEVKTEYQLLERENWEIIWKHHFKPLRIGRKLLILPPWESPSLEDGLITIYIDPGQAFGTGHHATTQLMLENTEIYLEELSEKIEEPKVLDLGCGTGILAIAVAKLYHKAKILAVDIDELALEATRKNADLNQVLSQIKISDTLDESLRFHLILANIGLRELQALLPTLKRVSYPEETILILSGILREDLPQLEEHYLNQGFKRVKRQFLKEWSLLILRAPSK
ncbi:MAG: 50S ribosomal protein L11 methyltransferase [Caldimicrobium sp.]|nr:50S ribosomal protein L11 methyltransferase [Caldimicrobium sp.]MCX7613463.1 50S ribosomal protein L11 methyltransferase [Caldimicrobium sp.]MDW8182965.1 50S ribosomal protein L11 methyltransferase [Caldimicrobium sp.]